VSSVDGVRSSSDSGGRFHLCRAALALENTWHVEHMVPKALGGGDQPLNLVASCVKCNLEMSDRTAVEFVTSQIPESPTEVRNG
jgi:5-methylcytosine-specific restriction endonuclease McrA